MDRGSFCLKASCRATFAKRGETTARTTISKALPPFFQLRTRPLFFMKRGGGMEGLCDNSVVIKSMKHGAPHLIVSSVETSVDFYCNVLGFRCSYKYCSGVVPLAVVSHGHMEIVLVSRQATGWYTSAMAEWVGTSQILYVFVEQVEKLFQRVYSMVAVVKEYGTTSWGTREFWIEDPDGHRLSFFEELC